MKKCLTRKREGNSLTLPYLTCLICVLLISPAEADYYIGFGVGALKQDHKVTILYDYARKNSAGADIHTRAFPSLHHTSFPLYPHAGVLTTSLPINIGAEIGYCAGGTDPEITVFSQDENGRSRDPHTLAFHRKFLWSLTGQAVLPLKNKVDLVLKGGPVLMGARLSFFPQGGRYFNTTRTLLGWTSGIGIRYTHKNMSYGLDYVHDWARDFKDNRVKNTSSISETWKNTISPRYNGLFVSIKYFFKERKCK